MHWNDSNKYLSMTACMFLVDGCSELIRACTTIFLPHGSGTMYARSLMSLTFYLHSWESWQHSKSHINWYVGIDHNHHHLWYSQHFSRHLRHIFAYWEDGPYDLFWDSSIIVIMRSLSIWGDCVWDRQSNVVVLGDVHLLHAWYLHCFENNRSIFFFQYLLSITTKIWCYVNLTHTIIFCKVYGDHFS